MSTQAAWLRTLLAAALLSSTSAASAQTGSLDRYAACKLPGGPGVVETAPLAEGVSSRSVDTAHGPVSIALSEGRRVMFAYPGEDFYANVKAEKLPAASYAAEKKSLIENFDHVVAGPGVSRNYALKPKLNGFDIYGLDRDKLEGGVLGVYEFFGDPRHEAVTIYFLNQDPQKRFHSLAEYAKLRDQFLAAYTTCLAAK